MQCAKVQNGQKAKVQNGQKVVILQQNGITGRLQKL
jgi:hypothetical protein